MFKGIFLFELSYRKARPVTYVYFVVVFLVSFLVIVTPSKNTTGTVLPNSPYMLTVLMVVLSFVFTMITSAVMGVSVVRDFDYQMESLLFSNHISKTDYLMGKFCGSFLTTVVINFGAPLGLMAGFALGRMLPWDVPWQDKELLSFNAWHYLQPFLLFTIPNILITGSFFFMSGALSRKSILIYTQGISLIILYQLASTFLKDVADHQTAALIDPFGVQTLQFVTRYWTPVEQNSMLLPFSGFMAFNRIGWMGLAIVALILTQYFFAFTVGNRAGVYEKNASGNLPFTVDTGILGKEVDGSVTYTGQIFRQAVFYFRMIFMEIPFIAIVASGMLFLFINAGKLSSLYGTSAFPTTYEILKVLDSFSLFFLIIAIFYSGELIWKERSINFNLIVDALPVSSFVVLFSKFLGLVLVYVVLLLLLILTGIVIQVSYGYYHFDLAVYFGTLYTSTLSLLIAYTLLSMFIQVVVNNKFLGFSICVLLFVVQSMLNNMGVEHNLLQFASGTLGVFSDMNLYGHFMVPFFWLRTYWIAFSTLLFLISVVFLVRGQESQWVSFRRSGGQRVTPALLLTIAAFIAIFVSSGAYIYYNTNVVNTFVTKKSLDERKRAYEQTFKQYADTPMPEIVESHLQVELHPSSRSFAARGYYYLKNKLGIPIREVHVQQPEHDEVIVHEMEFDRTVTTGIPNKRFRYFIYRFDLPLAPGDSVKMSFSESFRSRGFRTTNQNTDIVFNGTFFSNEYFPSIGYNSNFELTDDDNRHHMGLVKRERLPDRDDAKARETNLFGDHANRIRFDMLLGTEEDQTALAPGKLVDSWKKDGRRYFHYAMDKPMANFYSVVTARYAISSDSWQDVGLEIYYHPGHVHNLRSMTNAMKDALAYCSANFGPYPLSHLRIMEFPRYSNFAQSFAGTIPFSEGLGFILKVNDPQEDVDMAYYVTAHEVAHQWWGHQVAEAKVKGSGLLSEGMCQYSALMVMKHSFSDALIEKYLKYELDAYLAGRAQERKKENALNDVEGQQYIQYNKSSLAFYALQDYIGEERVNAAFRRYLQDWKDAEGPYPVSDDLLKYIREVTPDSLQSVVRDLFETITLFENKAVKALYEQNKDGSYQLAFTFSSGKVRADSTGVERNVDMGDWIDVGAYTRRNGREEVIYLKKHFVTQSDNTVTIRVKEKPSRVGIDPLHKLVDRHSDDNSIPATQAVEVNTILVD